MRKRNCRVQVRLDRDEYQHFMKLVKKSGVSQEVYLRHLINKLVPRELPPPDFYSMMKELHGIGNNLNQIASKAHTLNVLDVKRYDDNIALLDKAILKISNAVMLPGKIE